MKTLQLQTAKQGTVFPSTTKETTIDTSIVVYNQSWANTFNRKLSPKQLETALEIIEIISPKKSSMPVTDDTYGFPLPRSRR